MAEEPDETVTEGGEAMKQTEVEMRRMQIRPGPSWEEERGANKKLR